MKNLHPIVKIITPRIEDWSYETSQTNYFNENRENEDNRYFSGYFFSTLMPTVNWNYTFSKSIYNAEYN